MNDQFDFDAAHAEADAEAAMTAQAEADEAEAAAAAEYHADLADLKAEIDATDLTPLQPKDDDEARLWRFSKRYSLLVAERELIKHNLEIALRRIDGQLKQMERWLPELEPIVKGLLRGKTRSVKTPWGTLGFRKVNDCLEITDEQRLLAAATANEVLRGQIVVKRSLPKSALNDYFKTTGDLLDGVEVKPGGDKFYVKET